MQKVTLIQTRNMRVLIAGGNAVLQPTYVHTLKGLMEQATQHPVANISTGLLSITGI